MPRNSRAGVGRVLREPLPRDISQAYYGSWAASPWILSGNKQDSLGMKAGRKWPSDQDLVESCFHRVSSGKAGSTTARSTSPGWRAADVSILWGGEVSSNWRIWYCTYITTVCFTSFPATKNTSLGAKGLIVHRETFPASLELLFLRGLLGRGLRAQTITHVSRQHLCVCICTHTHTHKIMF